MQVSWVIDQRSLDAARFDCRSDLSDLDSEAIEDVIPSPSTLRALLIPMYPWSFCFLL
jgi:hypothetical protein